MALYTTATGNYVIYPSGVKNKSNYIGRLTTSDPYLAKRARHDEILHETLTETFRDRCRNRASRIKKLLREFDSEDEAILKLVLKQRPALRKILPQKTNLSLLWIAVLSCYQKSAELLVRSGADVNERCESKLDNFVDEKTTILHILLQMFPSSWNERLVALVINKGADLQTQDSEGQSVLQLAVIHGRVEITKMLLEKGVEVNVADDDGETPLLAAAIHSKADELVPMLVKHGADVGAKRGVRRMNALHLLSYARDVEHTDVARLLIEHGVSIDDREERSRYQPIHAAAILGKNELVKLFLDHGADVNSRAQSDVTPLYLAAASNDTAILLTLLKRGADIDLKTKTENNDDDNDNFTSGRTALHKACNRFARNIGANIKILISVGADICAEDDAGNTPYSVMNLVNIGTNREMRVLRSPDHWNVNADVMLSMLALKKSDLHPSIELEDERRIKESPNRCKYYQGCLEQINRLKSQRLIKFFTLFDLLTKCHCEIAALMWNHEFKKKFSLCDLNVFPAYAQDIRETFERAERHHLSMVKQEDVINEAVYNSLPYVIVRKVIEYIICEECDLRKIVQASRSRNLDL